MKRLLITVLAAATLAGPLAAGSEALARDGDQGRRWEQRGDRGRGDENRQREWRGSSGRERQAERRYERENGRNYYGPPPGAYAPPRAYGLRRGGYLPPQSHGSAVEDYGRYRLRPPPRGFRWVQVDGAFALVGPDGQIFDMIR